MDPALGDLFSLQPQLCSLEHVTRTSARLRNVQPDVNLDQSYEALKRQKKNADAAHAASTAEDKSRHQDSVQAKLPEEAGADDMNPDRPESSSADDSRHETSGGEASGHTEGSGSQDVTMSEAEVSSHVDYFRRLFVERTENYGIPLLERLYTRTMKGIFETKNKGVEDGRRYSILRFLVKFAENTANF
ncbi:ATPase family AAA domain-containing protein At1g05910 [Populus trichocarpa]|uniref:ATPase family AAA domain-containing protein At1g05910 n=1 Tax=Populus trichocarpa TaxID=3694 RepID=UPI002278BC88|nr:ATPase family AAA domain-containing protein At1g05910 [Populus trichocarpa]